MIVGSFKEDISIEKRISITPETSKNLKDLGIEVILEKNYGSHLGISDEEYLNQEVNFCNTSEEIIDKADLLAQVNCITKETSKKLKDQSILIGILNTQNNKETTNILLKKNIKIFSMELLPRITRAQSMDVLSSQANLAGYRAVIDSIYEFEKAVPMMMTAGGTVPAAKVFIIGAGVAGLQAIATAKRLGAIVSATDVRTASKEQVESLGGKFLTVDQEENLETAGGYAKEASEEFKKKQSNLLKDALKKNDIVICTALIPGKKAPRIISEEMVKLMKPGSIICDLAVEQGGNSAYSEVDKIVNLNGIKIIGASKIMNKLPFTASSLYAKNLFSFIRNLYNKEKKEFVINKEDEIINKTLIKGE